MKNKRAFTLLELLMAVLILAVLATVAVAGFQAYRDRTAMLVDETNQRTLHAAVKLFAYDTGALPGLLNGLPPRYYNSDARTIRCPSRPPGAVSYELAPGARGQLLSWLLNNAGADLIIEADVSGGPEVRRHERGVRSVVTTVGGQSLRRP